MKLKLNDIVSARIELDKIIKYTANEKIPGVLAIKFARLIRDLDPFYIDFEKQRNELARKYGSADPENSEQLIIPKEEVQKFNDEIVKMLSIDIELVPSISFTEDELNLIKIDVLEALALLPFIQPKN